MVETFCGISINELKLTAEPQQAQKLKGFADFQQTGVFENGFGPKDLIFKVKTIICQQVFPRLLFGADDFRNDIVEVRDDFLFGQTESHLI